MAKLNELKNRKYIEILEEELVPALGCTEPIAIAYAMPGEGLVKKNVEDTIRSVGKVAREGMKETDKLILQAMLE